MAPQHRRYLVLLALHLLLEPANQPAQIIGAAPEADVDTLVVAVVSLFPLRVEKGVKEVRPEVFVPVPPQRLVLPATSKTGGGVSSSDFTLNTQYTLLLSSHLHLPLTSFPHDRWLPHNNT